MSLKGKNNCRRSAEDSRTQGGRIPGIHCLTEQGAQAVYEWTGSYPKRVLRSDPTPFTFLSREGLAQCRRKLPGYAALIERRTSPYWSQLPNPTVRVFWVVPSPQRIKELSAAFHDSGIARVFRFTTFDCCDEGILTEPVWHDIEGTPLTIYQPAAGTMQRAASHGDAFRTDYPG